MLENCVYVCRSSELVAKLLSLYQEQPTSSVICKLRGKVRPNVTRKISKDCRFCGQRHQERCKACPAWSNNYSKFGQPNQFALKSKLASIHMEKECVDRYKDDLIANVLQMNTIQGDTLSTEMKEEGKKIKLWHYSEFSIETLSSAMPFQSTSTKPFSTLRVLLCFKLRIRKLKNDSFPASST